MPLPSQSGSPADPVQALKLERRSYIIGSLLVWAVIFTGILLAYASMFPQLFQNNAHETVHQAMQRLQQLPAPTYKQELVLEGIYLVGAFALFFLNWRFSFLLRRPRGAFVAHTGKNAPPLRWLWWIVLSVNSMFYTMLFPQWIITGLLAHWGTEEIRRLSAHPPSVPDSTA